MESVLFIFIRNGLLLRGSWPIYPIFLHRKYSGNLQHLEVMAPTKEVEDCEIDFLMEESLALYAT